MRSCGREYPHGAAGRHRAPVAPPPRRGDHVDMPHTRPTSYEIEALIREVQQKPAIWNKNYDGYTDRRLKSRMWEEVCESLIDDWKKLKALQKHKISCEVQKKWRNVKDAFKKELHIERKILAGHIHMKKKKYVHYDALSFLASAELNATENVVSLDGSDEESDSASVDQENTDSSARKRTVNENQDDDDNMVRVKRERFGFDEEGSNSELSKRNEDNNTEYFAQIELERFADDTSSITHKKFQNRASYPEENLLEIPCDNWDTVDNSVLIPKSHQDYTRSVKAQRDFKVYDEDVSFTEMIVPMLKKLNEDQKHFAKVEIMNLLYKAKRYRLALSAATQTDKVT